MRIIGTAYAALTHGIIPKTSASIITAAILSVSFMAATPAEATGEIRAARQGFVRCGAQSFLRMSDTEVHYTVITLRNFDRTKPITIKRLAVYNAQGVVIYDSANSGLPSFNNGILGPANSTLNPLQSSGVNSDNFFPYLSQTDRPAQLFIVWSSTDPVRPLDVSSTTVVRGRNPVTGAHLEERTRDVNECESVVLVW
jgi:hypothetical protein